MSDFAEQFFRNAALALKEERNVDVYEETMQICREGEYVAQSGTRIKLRPNAEVLAASVFYDNPPVAESATSSGGSEVDVVNSDCIDVAHELVREGFHPILLNMANRHKPGGGVLFGANAQEETLFRRSNLCVSLYQYSGPYAKFLSLPKGNGAYPMNRETGGIYSGLVTFFRADSAHDFALVDDPFECAVVSVAAINQPECESPDRLAKWAADASKVKIRSMLRIGLLHGHDAIVLGAWGCGAFGNPPTHMAELFKEVLSEGEFMGRYRRVRFAIIEDDNSRNLNYGSFAKVFGHE